jgi:2-methylisocitrate lyase-like PEP mutase family enzyme
MHEAQKRRAKTFRSLHAPGAILVLPNAWDAASARIFELENFGAIGTTSAGVAAALGFQDGNQADPQLVLASLQRICAAVQVPVTADVEAGYGLQSAELESFLGDVIAAGAVGVNLEDGIDPASGQLAPTELLVERIRAARRAAQAAQLELFVNARTDVYLLGEADPSWQLEEALRRARIYASAGADGIFTPGAWEPQTLAALAKGVALPLNVMAFDGVPPVPELHKLGVQRLSIGSGALQATLQLTRQIAQELRERGTYTRFTSDWLSYGEMNEMFAKEG